MSYETILILCVGAGLIGLALLVAHMGEIVWYWKREEGGPEVIITDAAFGALLWIMVYGGLVFSRWVFNWPEDNRVPILFLAFGFAAGPWFLLIRWIRWRWWSENGDDEWT